MRTDPYLVNQLLAKLASSDAGDKFTQIRRFGGHFILCFVLALVALVGLGSVDAAWSQGNNIPIACDGESLTKKVCRDGNSCQSQAVQTTAPVGSAASPQDRLVFDVPPQGADISYVITNPTVSGLAGQKNPVTGSILRQQPVNETLDTFSVAVDGSQNRGPYSAVPGEVHRVELDLPGTATYSFAVWEVTCEPNEQPDNTGNIVFEKQTDPSTADGTFGFSIERTDAAGLDETFDIDTTNGIGERGFSAIPVGTYDLAETTVPSGWVNDGLRCTRDGQQIVNMSGDSIPPYDTTVELGDGETITCRWRNRAPPLGALKIVKALTSDTDGNLDFTFGIGKGDTPIDPNFIVTAPTPGMRAIDLAPGDDYNVREILDQLPEGWELDPNNPPVCAIGDRPTGQLVGENGVRNISVESRQTTVCTFTNRREQRGKFIVKKIADGAGGLEFPFNITEMEGQNPGRTENFSLANGGLREFLPIGPTILEVKELVDDENFPEGWEFKNLRCEIVRNDRNSGAEVISVDGKVAKVKVVPDSIVRCIYINERQTGELAVTKQTIGGDNSFDFMISSEVIDPVFNFQLKNGETYTRTDLPTGSYMIEEKNLPEGWSLQNISCNQEFQRTDDKVTVDVVDDQKTVCTFTNFKEVDDRMEDVVKLYNYRNLSNLLDHGPDRARIIRRLSQAPPPSLKDTPLKYAGNKGTTSSAMSIGQGTTLLSGGGTDTRSGGISASSTFQGGPSQLQQQQLAALSSSMGLQSQGSGYHGAGSVTRPTEMPFGMKGSVSNDRFTGSVSFSLSQLRQSMASEEARKIAEAKAYGKAVGLDGNPYGTSNQWFEPLMTPQRLDAWVEFHVSQYDDDLGGISRDGDFGIGYVGVDYSISPSLLVGFLAQFDRTSEDVNDQDLKGEVDGHGWMVGPYVGARLTDNLYFSGRAAWGKSSNDIDLTDDAAGYRTGEFDSDRWLATAELIGNWQSGRLRFTPAIELAYGNQETDAFRNSLGQRVNSNDMTIGRLTFGPEFAYTYTGQNGTLIEPLVSIEGIWNFDTDSIVLSDGTIVDPEDDLRGRVTGGVVLRKPDGGMSMRIVGEYDGIGDSDFESYGAQIWLNFPLQRN